MDTLVKIPTGKVAQLASKLVSTGNILNEAKSHSEKMAKVHEAFLVLEAKTEAIENELSDRLVISLVVCCSVKLVDGNVKGVAEIGK